MSILIKGMEMPDSCFHCKLAEVCQHYKAEHYANKRHEDCPLEEVPSAQPEKVDIPTVDTPTCEDAVSRQAVYNVLDKMPVRGFKKDGETIHGLISLSQVNSAIIDLPSAQPEPLDEWCTDCKEYDHEKHCCPRWNRVIRQTLKDVQPEIVRCKDCKYWREGTVYSYCDKLFGMGVLDAYDYMTDEDDYCSMAERRTDVDANT